MPEIWFQLALQQGTAHPVCQAAGASVKRYFRKIPERERWREWKEWVRAEGTSRSEEGGNEVVPGTAACGALAGAEEKHDSEGEAERKWAQMPSTQRSLKWRTDAESGKGRTKAVVTMFAFLFSFNKS